MPSKHLVVMLARKQTKKHAATDSLTPTPGSTAYASVHLPKHTQQNLRPFRSVLVTFCLGRISLPSPVSLSYHFFFSHILLHPLQPAVLICRVFSSGFAHVCLSFRCLRFAISSQLVLDPVLRFLSLSLSWPLSIFPYFHRIAVQGCGLYSISFFFFAMLWLAIDFPPPHEKLWCFVYLILFVCFVNFPPIRPRLSRGRYVFSNYL